jgi:hypothetical protein
VKIQSKTIRKGYKRSKRQYSYTQHLLPFPTNQNQALKPFLRKELEFKMDVKGDTLNITLTKQKEKTAGIQNENPQNIRPNSRQTNQNSRTTNS